jgi:hypothetical protein
MATVVLKLGQRRREDPSEVLAAGVTFDWTTFGLQISSTVAEFVPEARLGWYGNGEGLRAYHTWLLVPREDSTYVVMEKSASATARRSSRAQTRVTCTVAATLWNISLKFLCET